MRVLITILLFSQTVLAGNGWIGSGGDLLEDAHNPWWVQNKLVVKYCVVFDQASMSSNEKDANEVVDRAFKNWMDEWKYFFRFQKSYKHPFSLGGQKLTKLATCDDTEDLSIRMGWGALTDKQQQWIEKQPNFERRGGVAVRTDYDSVNLMGKGFIYIASDKGPKKMKLGPKYMKEPWKYKLILSYMVAHELGHVFGVKHTDQFGGLMAENFLEYFLAIEIEPEFEKWYNQLHDWRFFSRVERYFIGFFGTVETIEEERNVASDLEDLFDSGPDEFYEIVPSKIYQGDFDVTTSVFVEETKEWKEQLTHRIEVVGSQPSIDIGDHNVSLYVTDEQTAIEVPEYYGNRIFIFTDFRQQIDGLLLNLKTGAKKPVFITKNADQMLLRSYNGSQHLSALFFSNLIGYMQLSIQQSGEAVPIEKNLMYKHIH